MRKRHIPVFLSVNNDNLPYLAVTLKSIGERLDGECVVDARVLTSDLATYNQRKLRHIKIENVDITIVDVNSHVEEYRADFEERLGEFYKEEIFYPFFIADMYPRLAKAMYVECGTLIRDNIEKIYHTELGNDFVGGVRRIDEFDNQLRSYRERWVGIDHEKYVDSSVMLMNLSFFRKYKISNRFARLLTGYNFDTISAADDYINFLCKGRVRILNDEWNIGSSSDAVAIFAPYRRPWHHVSIPYADEFWDIARKTPFYDDVRNSYFNFNEEEKAKEAGNLKSVLFHASKLADSKGGFYSVLGDNYLID